jgi:hypothetical protein
MWLEVCGQVVGDDNSHSLNTFVVRVDTVLNSRKAAVIRYYWSIFSSPLRNKETHHMYSERRGTHRKDDHQS